MKSVYFIMLLFIGVTFLIAQNGAIQQPPAIIEVQPAMFHLGKIPDSKIHNFAFTLVNHSSEIMKIDRVAVSCGCTIPEQNFDEVAPGQSTQLKIIFDPKGRHGYARWEILIYTTVKSMPVVMAPFDVEILKDGMLSQQAISFGEFQRGTSVEQEIWIAPADYPNFNIKNIELYLPDVSSQSFDISSSVDNYDGFYPGKRRAYKIKFAAKKDIPYGRLEGTVRITTDIPGHELIELPFLAKVSGLIGVRPDYIPMGTFCSGDYVIRRVMIFHREGQSFQIHKVESDLPFLSTGVVPVLEDQYYQVIVTVKKDAQLALGEFRGKITVFTSYEDMPKIVLPLQGIVIEKK